VNGSEVFTNGFDFGQLDGLVMKIERDFRAFVSFSSFLQGSVVEFTAQVKGSAKSSYLRPGRIDSKLAGFLPCH
jgi:hypothetical protein